MLVLAPPAQASVAPDTNMQRILESYIMAQIESGQFPEPNNNAEGGLLFDSLCFVHGSGATRDTFTLKDPMWNPLIFCTASHLSFGVCLRRENGGDLLELVLPDNKWFYIPGLVRQIVLTKLAADTATTTYYGVLGLADKPRTYMRLK